MTTSIDLRLARQEAQKAFARELEAAEQAAREKAIALRSAVHDYLAAHLSNVQLTTVTGEAPSTHLGLIVRADRDVSYRLHFKADTARGFSRRFEAVVNGDQFDRYGRYYTPSFRPRKDGTYNLKALLADVQTALELQAQAKRRRDSREQSEQASHATLNAIAQRTGAQLSSPSRVEYDINGLKVSVTAGAINGGLVKVEISLKDPFRPADQVIALLTKLSLADGNLPPGYTVVGAEDVPDNHRVPGALYTVMGPSTSGEGRGSFGSGRTRDEAIDNALAFIRGM